MVELKAGACLSALDDRPKQAVPSANTAATPNIMSMFFIMVRNVHESWSEAKSFLKISPSLPEKGMALNMIPASGVHSRFSTALTSVTIASWPLSAAD